MSDRICLCARYRLEGGRGRLHERRLREGALDEYPRVDDVGEYPLDGHIFPLRPLLCAEGRLTADALHQSSVDICLCDSRSSFIRSSFSCSLPHYGQKHNSSPPFLFPFAEVLRKFCMRIPVHKAGILLLPRQCTKTDRKSVV